MDPNEYCRQKAAPIGSSLYYALLFLPPRRRHALTALHAFCRDVQDIADECSDEQLARAKLAWWRLEVGRLYQGKPDHPVTNALLPFLEQVQIKAVPLLEFIDAMEIGLAQSRYLDFTGLQRYCNRVSAANGPVAAQILGFSNARTIEYAGHLGNAIALTRIILDVGADARNNRIYLPMDELKRFGVPAVEILQLKHSDNFSKLMRFQAHRVEALYDTALSCLPREDRQAQRAGLIIATIYRATLAEVERDGFRVLTHRTSLTPLRKLWLAWKTWIST